jgi:CRP-like cAMP-binding protein
MTRLVELQHGDVLIRERHSLAHFYIIKSGTLVAFRADRTLITYRRKDVVGLETALEGREAPFTVVATGKVEALEIPVERFVAMEKDSPLELRALARHFIDQSEHALLKGR